MTSTSRLKRLYLVAGAAVTALTIMQCNSSNPAPTTPTPTVSVSSIALSAGSITAGGTVQATVTISSAAPTGGSTVTLSSSATSVATVPGTVTVTAGATTQTFTVSSVTSGSATITATLNGNTTATLTVTAVTPPPTLLGISLGATAVQGLNSVSGAATLSGPTPSGGAVVTLTWSDPIVAPTPTSVTVAAGQTRATFTISTRAVGGTIPTTITGSYNGVSASAALSVTPIPPPVGAPPPAPAPAPPPVSADVKIATGDYTLTFTAGSNCTDVPDYVRSRTYAANIAFSPAYNQYFVQVAGTESSCCSGPGGFGIGVAGNNVEITDDTAGEFFEVTPPFNRLEFSASGGFSAATPTVSTMSFPTVVVYCELSQDSGGYFCQAIPNKNIVKKLAFCPGNIILAQK